MYSSSLRKTEKTKKKPRISKQGVGTTFTIVFPFRLQPEENMPEDIIIEQESTEINLAGKRVLLVEDNEMNREIAEELLAEAGLNIETAEDGIYAVDIMKKKDADYYDFILMDIQMPIMNGYEATKLIREMYPEKHVPIIAVSANAFEEDKKASLEAGMDAHVSKPIVISELFSVLR